MHAHPHTITALSDTHTHTYTHTHARTHAHTHTHTHTNTQTHTHIHTHTYQELARIVDLEVEMGEGGAIKCRSGLFFCFGFSARILYLGMDLQVGYVIV